MQRRSFLRAISLGATYVSLPSLALPPERLLPAPLVQTVYTAEGLTGVLESLFTCKVGEPMAFMQWTDMLAAHQWLTPNAFQAVRDKEKELIRITYQTIGYAIEGGDAKEAEAKLVQFCLEEFEAIAKGDEKKMLIWRTKPEFHSADITKWDKVYMTSEEIEDRVDLKIDMRKIRGADTERHLNHWAFNVPEGMGGKDRPPIDVPEGVDWDWETQSLRFFKEKTKLHSIRMRVAIPEYRIEEAGFAKPEGAPFPRPEVANG